MKKRSLKFSVKPSKFSENTRQLYFLLAGFCGLIFYIILIIAFIIPLAIAILFIRLKIINHSRTSNYSNSKKFERNNTNIFNIQEYTFCSKEQKPSTKSSKSKIVFSSSITLN